MQVTTSERGPLLIVHGAVFAILTPRLLKLAKQSEFAAKLYNEDGAINAENIFNALDSFWYDGFVQRYKEGEDFDRMEEELEQELIEAEVEWDKATERKGDIEGALSLLEGVLEGKVCSPSTSSLKEFRPATLSEMKEEIIRRLGAYYLRYQLWEDADVLKAEGERLLARARQRERKAEQRLHVITWRKFTLKRARKNCLRYGDLRRWHERYDVSVPKPSENEAPAPSTAKLATKKQLQHLKRAREILEKHPEISSEEEWEEAYPGPAESAKKCLQRLCRKILELDHNQTPSHYCGFSGGIQTLVQDLWRGEVRLEDEQDSKRQR